MASDVFHTVNGAIYFQDIQSIGPEKQTIHTVTGTKIYIYNVVIWREFKAQYDTWKLEQNKINSETFIIRGHDYKFADVISVSPDLYIVSFEHTYEQFTPEKFGDFLIAYGNWIKQRKKIVNYPDGWYKAQSKSGDTSIFKLKNNLIAHPQYKSTSMNSNINNSYWTNIESIDPNSDEFYKLLSEMF